jgi:hypothetical protein
LICVGALLPRKTLFLFRWVHFKVVARLADLPEPSGAELVGQVRPAQIPDFKDAGFKDE